MLLLSRPALPQAVGPIVRVRVVEAAGSRPIAGAIVVLLDSAGRSVARGLSNEGGRLVLHGPGPGVFRLRADRIGHPGITGRPFTVTDTISQVLAMPLAAATLPEVTATGLTRCDGGARSERTADLWSEISKGLTASVITVETEQVTLAVRRFRRYRSLGLNLKMDSTIDRFVTRTIPFVSAEPEALSSRGFIQEVEGHYRFFAPDAKLLLSDAFLATHCFQVAERGATPGNLVGLAFKPVPGRNLADISGTLWVDRDSALLRHVEFEYVNAPPRVAFPNIGGRIAFQRSATGAWTVGDWYIRTADRVQIENPSARRFQAVPDTVIGYVDEGGVASSIRDGASQLGEIVAGVVSTTVVTGELVGHVRSDDGRPIAHAMVTVPGLDSVFATSEQGDFRIGELPVGPVPVRIVAIGFAPRAAVFRIQTDRRLVDTTFVLRKVAQPLAPLEVIGRTDRVAGKLEDFERRRNAGFGNFLTRAALAEWEGLPLSAALRRIRGVTLLPRAWACGGGFTIAATRSARLAPCVVGAGCPLAVYLDGNRVYDGDPALPAPNIDDYLTDRVEAVEVYGGAGEAPVELNGTGNACGSVVIWTRITSNP